MDYKSTADREYLLLYADEILIDFLGRRKPGAT